jgi:UDP-sugar diphosphatase
MFYTEVDDSMLVKGGGGGLADTGESIEVLALPLEQADAFVFDSSLAKSPGLMFGVLWLQRKLSRDTT